MFYKHTQIGNLVIATLVVLILYFGFILTQAGFDQRILFIMVLVLLILASFSTLNVMIDETHLRIKFGYGIFKKSFSLNEIVSVRIVKNHWYYGWGIRYWFWPKMRIFNISGFDAVEIKMVDNKIYRIGTDEPKKLEQVILEVIKK
jgi:CTP:phosphocholine cytidylyltransferase-like protein